MSTRIGRRTLGFAAGMAMTLASLAQPAASAARTRWVDDDGQAGRSGCGGTATAQDTIQGAIDAAAAGDTILVCPGKYVEAIVIRRNHLTVRSVQSGRAVIVAPPHFGGILVEIKGRRDTSLVGFKLTTRAGTACTATVDVMVHVQDSRNTTLRGNEVKAGGDDTLLGCGYLYGIVISSPGDKSSSAYVGYNTVRDFKIAGIEVNGERARATVFRNSVRFYHLGVAGQVADAVGISIIQGATVRAERNVVRGDPDAGTGPGHTPILGVGILTLGHGPDSRITNNVVSRANIGIEARASLGGRIDHNTVVRSFGPGIHIEDSVEGRVDHQSVRDGRKQGILVQSASDYVISANDFRGNKGTDCRDTTSGGGTAGTANTWTGDLGRESDPAGICSAT